MKWLVSLFKTKTCLVLWHTVRDWEKGVECRVQYNVYGTYYLEGTRKQTALRTDKKSFSHLV